MSTIKDRDDLSAVRTQRASTGKPSLTKINRNPSRMSEAVADYSPPPKQRAASVHDAAVRGSIGKKTDSEKARMRHEQRKNWFIMEASRQAANRSLMAKCESFYDSEQWNEEDAQVVRDRGQNPIVYNEIKPTIDWLIGTERRTRVDFTVVAEGEDEADSDDASNKSKLLKFLDDTNNAAFERSWACEDAFKAGIGWLEVGIRGDKSDVPIYVGNVSWRDILWDSQATKRDLSDSRYIFRIKVVDEDVAKAIFPDKEIELDRCVQVGDQLQIMSEWLGGLGLITGLDDFNWLNDDIDHMTPRPVDMFNTRRRILLLECWSREPVPRKTSTDGMGDPVQFDVHVAIMTEHDTLIEAKSPFKHDRFPFVPVWAYRNRRTGLPYSPIRPLLGPQEGLNHRMCKSLFEASSNQVEMEKGAVDPEVMDLQELRDEYNAPDGMPVFADGAIQNNKVRKVANAGAASQQLELAAADRMTIRSMSGVTGENRGEETNSISGKAVLAKQDQGSLLTMELFDNILLARQMEGVMTLSLSEQFIVQPMTIRVAGDGGHVDRVKINQPGPVSPDGTPTYMNDITARRAHFVVGEQAWKQSYAEAAFSSLMDVLAQLSTAAPQVVVNLLDLVFEMHPNLPHKKQIVDRMRKINGQTAPDGKLTPEQMQEQMQAKAMAQAQFELQMAQLKADVTSAQAKGQDLQAAAMLKRLTSIYEAAQAAAVLVAQPQSSPVADELLRSAGFQDMAGGNTVIDGNIPPATPAPTATAPPQGPRPMNQTASMQQTDGAAAGIETPALDGAVTQ